MPDASLPVNARHRRPGRRPAHAKLECDHRSTNPMNWGWFLLRIVIASTVFTTLFLSQRFWYRAIWRVSARWSAVWLRVAVRLLYVIGILLVIAAIFDGVRVGRHGHLFPRDALLTIFSGLWFSSALFAFLAVKTVH